MTKAELNAKVAKAAGLTQANAGKAIEALVEVIVAETKKGEKVQVNGLGIFYSKKRAARTGVNPATKEKIKIPAATVPAFKTAKAYKDAFAKKGKK